MKNNWRNLGTNWFNNDIDVIRKKTGENHISMNIYRHIFYLQKTLLEAILRKKMKKNGEKILWHTEKSAMVI